MVRKREKISDETVQLYLMDELDGPLFDIIQSIDEAPDSNVLSARDSKIKETITKLRSVDQMLQEAADASFEMPAELSAKIEVALAADKTKIKRPSVIGLTAIKGIFNWSNFWSMASGTALASLGFLVLINLQPQVFVSVIGGHSAEFGLTQETEILGFSNDLVEQEILMRNAESDKIAILERKLATLLAEHSRVVEESRVEQRSEFKAIYEAAPSGIVRNSLAAKHGNFTITEGLAFRVVVSDSTGEVGILGNGSEAFVHQSFNVDLLPLQDLELSILYRSSDDVKAMLVSNERLAVGKPYSFPADLNGEATWQFADPVGIDSLIFRTSGGSVHEITFSVKK